MTMKLIETLKTSIYNTKHTNNTKAHFQMFKIWETFKNPYSKNKKINKFKLISVLCRAS